MNQPTVITILPIINYYLLPNKSEIYPEIKGNTIFG